MNPAITSTKSNRLPSIALGILVALWIAGVLAGRTLSLGISDRTAFIILVAAGFALCATGMQLGRFGWTNPFNILGIVVGTIMLPLSLAVLFGVSLPFVPNDRAAFIDMSALMAGKVLIDIMRGLASR